MVRCTLRSLTRQSQGMILIVITPRSLLTVSDLHSFCREMFVFQNFIASSSACTGRFPRTEKVEYPWQCLPNGETKELGFGFRLLKHAVNTMIRSLIYWHLIHTCHLLFLFAPCSLEFSWCQCSCLYGLCYEESIPNVVIVMDEGR
uniref:Uncharacterized protein n=1 Tax=Arundo donax TaxID=35708 RepID=A0A0A9G583_ARUDO